MTRPGWRLAATNPAGVPIYEAQAAGADTLVTAGAVQSNHCRQTVAAAARLGLNCTLVLLVTRPAPGREPLLYYLLGAELVFTERPRVQDKLEETFQNLRKAGKKPI